MTSSVKLWAWTLVFTQQIEVKASDYGNMTSNGYYVFPFHVPFHPYLKFLQRSLSSSYELRKLWKYCH